MQQRTPEQIEDVLQFREETIDAVMLPHERGQQPTVEETVEEGRLFLHERVRQPIVRVSVEMGRLDPAGTSATAERRENGGCASNARRDRRGGQGGGCRMNEGNSRPSRRHSKGRLVPHERVQQRSAEKNGGCASNARRDRRGGQVGPA